MRVSVVQLNATRSHEDNVANALRLIDRAAAGGAEFVQLPEYSTFNGPLQQFQDHCEPVPGPTSQALGEKARQHNITIAFGSLTQKVAGRERFYNTSLLFTPNGELAAAYNKVHLFDVDVPGKVTQTESSVFMPGDQLLVVDLPEFCYGMSICFDLRFPEVYRALALAGAEVLGIPSAFARGTGEAHWHTLVRARAIENLAYVLASDQFGAETAGHYLYGHSLIVDPWGVVLAEAPAEEEAVLFADIDIGQVRKRRAQIPVLDVRRPAAYTNVARINLKKSI